MSERIRTAMLLSAGLGTRMRPLTDDRPKPMIEVAGRTLIDRLLDKLARAGVERAVVNVHWKAEVLEDHLRGRSDIEVLISDERDRLLETGGGVVKALPLLGEEPVYILNTDALWPDERDSALIELAAAFDPERMDALLLLAPMDNTLGFDGPGDFFLGDDARLERRGDRASAPFAYAGVYVMNPQHLTRYPVEPFSANVYWSESLKAGRLFGQVMAPFWMHVGDPAARDAAEARLLAAQTGA